MGVRHKWTIAPNFWCVFRANGWLKGQKNGQTGQKGGKIIKVGEKGPQNENVFSKSEYFPTSYKRLKYFSSQKSLVHQCGRSSCIVDGNFPYWFWHSGHCAEILAQWIYRCVRRNGWIFLVGTVVHLPCFAPPPLHLWLEREPFMFQNKLIKISGKQQLCIGKFSAVDSAFVNLDQYLMQSWCVSVLFCNIRNFSTEKIHVPKTVNHSELKLHQHVLKLIWNGMTCCIGSLFEYLWCIICQLGAMSPLPK